MFNYQTLYLNILTVPNFFDQLITVTIFQAICD